MGYGVGGACLPRIACALPRCEGTGPVPRVRALVASVSERMEPAVLAVTDSSATPVLVSSARTGIPEPSGSTIGPTGAVVAELEESPWTTAPHEPSLRRRAVR